MYKHLNFVKSIFEQQKMRGREAALQRPSEQQLRLFLILMFLCLTVMLYYYMSRLSFSFAFCVLFCMFFLFIVLYYFVFLSFSFVSNAQRGNGIWEKGLRAEPGFLEPCRAEKNKGSTMRWGVLRTHCPSFVALRGFTDL